MTRGKILFSLIIGLFLVMGFVSALTLQEQESLILGYNAKLKNYADIAKMRVLTPGELGDALNIVKLRKVQMLDVLTKDTSLFAKLILDSSVIASLPDSVKGEIEIFVEKSGRINIEHADDFEGNNGKFLFSFKENDALFDIYFIDGIFEPFSSDDLLEFSGYKLGNSIFVIDLQIFLQEGGGGAFNPNTMGEQKVAVIFVGFKDRPFSFPFKTRYSDTITREEVEKVFFRCCRIL